VNEPVALIAGALLELGPASRLDAKQETLP
jgi:hypothetical protein